MTVSIPWIWGSGNIYVTFSGSGNGNITITSDQNDTYIERVQEITVYSDKAPYPRIPIVVKQSPKTISPSLDFNGDFNNDFSSGAVHQNYKVFGNPSINGNIYTPDPSGRGFICTDKVFSPAAGQSWIIQTRYRINTQAPWKDIFSSVGTSGQRVYGITTQTNDQTQNGRNKYVLYLSGNGTSWNIINGDSIGLCPATGSWITFQLVCQYSNGQYQYFHRYPDQSSDTTHISKSQVIRSGNYVAFGGGFANSGIAADFDLSYTKIWIDGQLWWSAL